MPPWAPSIVAAALSWGTVPAWLRYLIAFLIPLVATLILTPMAGRLAGRFELMDRPGGHKTHLGATPYLGGVAVAGGLLLVGWLSAGASGQLLVVVGGALVLGFVGLLDDVQPVSPWIRLAYQVVAAIALWLVGVRAGVFDATWIDLPITVLWVVAVTNAFNFIDNMDGIAAGVAIASALGIAAIAGYNGDYLVTSLALATAGAALGFLRYNIPPAKIFLGDAGSMLLGFMVAALDPEARPSGGTIGTSRVVDGAARRRAAVRSFRRPDRPAPRSAADLARQHGPHIASDGRRPVVPAAMCSCTRSPRS